MTKLLVALSCDEEVHLVYGTSHISYTRIQSIIDSGAQPILISNTKLEEVPISFKTLIETKRLIFKSKVFGVDDLTTLGNGELNQNVDRVFVSLPLKEYELKKRIYSECKARKIPVNIADNPELCTFTLLSTFTSGDFQLGVTTSGKGCRLASRIKREIANSLPSNIGDICDKIGELRAKIQNEDEVEALKFKSETYQIGEHEEDSLNNGKFNNFVSEFEMTEEQKKLQRSRWLSQIVEYFPLQELAKLSIEDLTDAYAKQNHNIISSPVSTTSSTKKGSISLVGSGPGSVSLLTIGALSEINSADLVLADKLVPQQVLDIIPRNTEVFIARKFPGNAEKAQEELLSIGLSALQEGKKVIRLKQGDPYIFGRGGEEYSFFKKNGFEPSVLPGITSALAAPVMTNIPATHREVADQVLICTGTGRRGVLPNLPDFSASRTTVFLMALHRVVDLIPELIKKGWNPDLPTAIIERASCPDQRIVRTTLQHVATAVEAVGSRPPGLLVTGYACEVIEKLNDGEKWRVEEGCKGLASNSVIDAISSLQL